MRSASSTVRSLVATGIVAVVSLGPGLGMPVGAHEADVSVTFESGRANPGPYAYEPDRIEVGVGGTVTWENHDDLTDTSDDNAVDHPTNCSQGESRGSCPWSSNPLPPGETFSVTFPEPGTFAYFCAIHPYMEGTIVVGDGNPPPPEPDPSASSSPAPSPSPSSSADPTPTSEASDPDEPAPTQDPVATDEPEPAASGDEDAEPTDSSTTTASPSGPDDDSSDTAETPDDEDDTTADPDDTMDEAAQAADETDDASGNGGVKTLAAVLVGIAGIAVFTVLRGWRP